MTMLHQPFDEIRETGVLELVGKDEQVDQNEYGASVSFNLPGDQPSSGELLAFAFYATEEDSGAVQDSAGELFIFDADPAPSVGDSALTGAEWQTLIGRVKVSASDWTTDTGGGVAYIFDNPVPFHAVQTLYLVWFHTDATSLNDGASDDEVLDVNVWYLRYS